jgi:hypothetical protein
MEVKLNQTSNNPFYGLRNCLNLTQAVGSTISESMLNTCWNEVKENKEHRELFFSILFSVGDITARQHNIFGGVKKDSGGNANREGFYTIFNWLRTNHKQQFVKFLNAGLFNEYQCFDTLFRSRVQTKGSKVLKVYDIFADDWYREELLKYVYAVINGKNPFNKLLIAKFLTIPRFSKRAGHKKMLPQTKQVMENKAKFLVELSKLMGWEYEVKGTYVNFKGYREWRKEFNGSLESVLFSTGKINEFDESQFLDWFDKLPSQARFRVKNRILYSKVIDTDCETAGMDGKSVTATQEVAKWAKFQPWVAKWEAYKEQKQTEQRVLEEKVRQGQASEEDKVKLQKVKKEAKVNVGATNFKELYQQIISGRVDGAKLEAFIQNKVNLPYNTLVIIDDSGSMSGMPFSFASFIASVCLCKNPDDDGRNLVGLFGRSCRWFSHIDREAAETPNSIMRRNSGVKSVNKPFVDPTKSFMDNYKNISSYLRGMFGGGWTDISTLIKSLKVIMTDFPQLKDALKDFPVWTIISDGEWNNLPSPESSVADLLRQCEIHLGFKPFIVAMDVTNGYDDRYMERAVEKFSGIDNLMYIPSNPAQIEQFLTNFKDMDVFDVYTPLQSIHRSNRYELVRANTL